MEVKPGQPQHTGTAAADGSLLSLLPVSHSFLITCCLLADSSASAADRAAGHTDTLSGCVADTVSGARVHIRC